VSLNAIDWQRPWLAPLADAGRRAAARVAAGVCVADALNALAPPGVHFVPQSALPPGMPYERFVFETRGVPTRDNLHDFFNGLIWLHYPQAKRRLNAWQAADIAARGVGPSRGPLRDAITVFDENGAVFVAPPELREALAARQWRRLFVDLRPLWRQARLLLFGHALLEQLVSPRKSLTAHVYKARIAIESEQTWMHGWRRIWTPGTLRASRSIPCRFWACRSGGPKTRTFASMMTLSFSAARAPDNPRTTGRPSAAGRA